MEKYKTKVDVTIWTGDNSPRRKILSAGDIITGEYVPAKGYASAGIEYKYAEPSNVSGGKVFIPMQDLQKYVEPENKDNNIKKITLKEKFTALSTSQKVGVFMLGSIILGGIGFGVVSVFTKKQ